MPSYHDVYPEKWLAAKHLEGKARVVTITRVFLEPVFNSSTKKNENRLVASMTNTEKLLTINRTNAGTLEEISGTDDYAKWIGLRVRLEPARAQNGKDTILIKHAPAAAAQQEVHGRPPEPLVHGRQSAPQNGGENAPVHGMENTEPTMVHGPDAIEEDQSTVVDPKSGGDSQRPSEADGDGVFFSPTDLELEVKRLHQESDGPMSQQQFDFLVTLLGRFSKKGPAIAQLLLTQLLGRAATVENPPGVKVGKYLYEIMKEGSTMSREEAALRNFCERIPA